jgi:hypothetical protein
MAEISIKKPDFELCGHTTISLRIINYSASADYQQVTDLLQKSQKKILKKYLGYKKNTYLCSVLINN